MVDWFPPDACAGGGLLVLVFAYDGRIVDTRDEGRIAGTATTPSQGRRAALHTTGETSEPTRSNRCANAVKLLPVPAPLLYSSVSDVIRAPIVPRRTACFASDAARKRWGYRPPKRRCLLLSGTIRGCPSAIPLLRGNDTPETLRIQRPPASWGLAVYTQHRLLTGRSIVGFQGAEGSSNRSN